MSTDGTAAGSGHLELAFKVSPIAFHGFLLLAQLAAFSILRPYFKNIYQPRTEFVSKERRAPALSNTFLSWLPAVYRADYEDIRNLNGLDAYFYTRFLRVLSRMLCPVWLLSWLVLMPLDSREGSGRKHHDFNRFTMASIATGHYLSYLGHIVIHYATIAWILYNLKVELRAFVEIRQAHYTKTEHALSPRARTILIQNIPEDLRTEHALKRLFSKLPGGVEHVEFVRKLHDAHRVFLRRRKAEDLYEETATSFLKSITKLKTKDPELQTAKRRRPKHRTGFLGVIGPKVDTMDWAREEIKKCTQELQARDADTPSDRVQNDSNENDRNPAIPKKSAEKDLLGSAFITFHDQIAAHLALNSLTHDQPYRMTRKWIEVAPSDIIWKNLNGNAYGNRVRMAFSLFATSVLVVAWLVPVIFITGLSSKTCCDGNAPKTTSWLRFLCNLNPTVLGIMHNLIPAALLRTLFILPPIILRKLAKFEGKPKHSEVELCLVNRYFAFQFFNSFLVILFGTLAPYFVWSDSNKSGEATHKNFKRLGEHLTRQSFFWSVVILQEGLTLVGAGSLRINALLRHFWHSLKVAFRRPVTPRAIRNARYNLDVLQWGTGVPEICLLVVITFTYGVVAPIVNGFACVTFYLLYLLTKYRFLWVYDQQRVADTGGLFYPRAIQNIFVGLYMQQILVQLMFHFFHMGRPYTPVGIVLSVLLGIPIVVTALFHWILNHSYGPLQRAIPLTKFAEKPEPEEQNQVVQEVTQEATVNGETGIQNVEKAPAYDKRMYAHPYLHGPQRIVWIPSDSLGAGLAAAEVAACTEVGVRASCARAYIDQKGEVHLSQESDVLEEGGVGFDFFTLGSEAGSMPFEIDC